MADQLGRSVGDMYEGAFIPGIVLAILYALYIFLVTVFAPNAAPGLPLEAQTLREVETAKHPLIFPLATLSAAATAYFFRGPMSGCSTGRLRCSTRSDWAGSSSKASGSSFLVAVLTRPFIGIIRTMTMSLFLVLVSATAIGIVAMKFTEVKSGADYVVLTMSITVAVSFVLAVLNRLLRLKLLSKLAEQVIFVMVPPLGLIFLVLGTIFIGVATPTEGGAMGAAGAMILAMMKGRLTFSLTRQAAEATAKLSAFVILILVGARVFSLTFYGVDGHRWVEELLVGLPGGQVGFLIFVNAFVFVLAFFLDFFELGLHRHPAPRTGR